MFELGLMGGGAGICGYGTAATAVIMVSSVIVITVVNEL